MSNKTMMIPPRDAVPMDERIGNLPQPTEAVFFRMAISMTGGNIEIGYTAKKVVTGITDHGDFESQVKTLISSNNGDIGNGRVKRTRDANANQAGRTKDTLLSINFDRTPLRYVVLKLSSRHNWQFSSSCAPFMMDRSDEGKNRFFEARRFDPTGNVIDGAVVQDGCKFAYFIVDPTKFKTNSQGEFQHRFNIHIDLLEMNGSLIDNRIPIIIDPDVRHPGGNGGP